MSVVLPLRAKKRIQTEANKFRSECAEGMELEIVADDIWLVRFSGPVGSIYAGERFTIRARFTAEYPFDSPEVVFLDPVPMHCHVYSNGHICLNILGSDWSPALSVQSVVLSIQSMLASATAKEWPADNASYVSKPRAGPKKTSFVYHDDSV